MKLENTPEAKARFFALYYMTSAIIYSNGYWTSCNNTYVSNLWHREDSKILLTPLSKITDEDAIEVAKIFGWHSYSDESKIHQVKEFLFNKLDYHTTNISANEYFQLLDFLRSKGYYVGDGTEIEYNWCRLKESQDLK